MNYQTFEPCADLEPLVKCYWTLESPAVANPLWQTIVPDGCMEMILHHGDSYRQLTGENRSILQPRFFVFGQLKGPLKIQPTGKTGIFAVRFHPDGFMPLANLPLIEMENSAVPLVKLFGKSGLTIEKKMLGAPGTSARISLIEAFLLDRLTKSENIDRIVKSTVDTLLTANGRLSVNELSRQTKTNRRQLERKFSAVIGLSPKQLAKTIRLQHTLKLMLRGDYTSFTSLAHQGEYYDQAHFNKDFREFTGLSPKAFYKENLKMSALFYGSD